MGVMEWIRWEQVYLAMWGGYFLASDEFRVKVTHATLSGRDIQIIFGTAIHGVLYQVRLGSHYRDDTRCKVTFSIANLHKALHQAALHQGPHHGLDY
jgi:hypothetical protein